MDQFPANHDMARGLFPLRRMQFGFFAAWIV
jgi:hypothetical protein